MKKLTAAFLLLALLLFAAACGQGTVPPVDDPNKDDPGAG